MAEKKSLVARLKEKFNEKFHRDKEHYISGSESRSISRLNRRTVRQLERSKKKRNINENEYLTEMKDPDNIVEFDDLHTYFFTDAGTSKAVAGVTFSIPKGKTVGVVGESGCGKSVTSLSLMQLVQGPTGQIVSGAIRFNAQDYVKGSQPLEPVMGGDGVQEINEQGFPSFRLGKLLRDSSGKPVPIYELNGDGTVKFERYTPELAGFWKLVKRLFSPKQKLRLVQTIDEIGYTQFFVDPETGKMLHGRAKIEPIYEADEKGAVLTQPVKGRDGLIKIDRAGNVVTRPVQKLNVQGLPAYRVGKLEVKNDGRPIPRFQLNTDGTIVLEELQPKKNKLRDWLLKFTDKEPQLRPVQAKDDFGALAFHMEDKVYDIAKMPISEMSHIRGKQISMIFQEPMTSLNPVFTVGNQLDEVVLLHTPEATKAVAQSRSIEMLKLVGIAMPESVYKRYPHELSGGMRQRVMIAMALACNPRLVIADEPTTALDVTIQAQILDLLREVKNKIKGSIMLITHDLGVIAEMADYVVVMYAGRIVEKGTVKEIFEHPLHPYTQGLQKSKPVVNRKVDKLYSIPGHVPNPINMPPYCYFRDRCGQKCAKCGQVYPPMVQVSETHSVSCYLYAAEEN